MQKNSDVSIFLLLKIGMVLILFSISVVQISLFSSLDNIICVVLSFLVSSIACLYLLNYKLIKEYALSSLTILLFVISNLSLPLVATLFDAHPIIYNLKNPVETYEYIAGVALTLIVAQWLYRYIRPLQILRAIISTKIYRPCGLFDEPSDGQLWIMGACGSIALLYVGLTLKDTESSVGILAKFIQGFTSFAIAPFLILLSSVGRDRRTISLFQTICLIGYFGIILGLSIGGNSRGTFAAPLYTIGAATLLRVLSSNLSLRAIDWRKVAAVAVIMLIGMRILADLATAMVINRKDRHSVNTLVLIESTLSTLQDQNALATYRQQAQNGGERLWDERYLLNPFLARFCSVKFHDLGLSLATPEMKNQLIQFAQKRLWLELPTPVLSFMGISANKEVDGDMSQGDYLYYVATGDTYGLGTHRVGSFIAEGIVIFGRYFFWVEGGLAILVFIVLDAFSLQLRVPVVENVIATGSRKYDNTNERYRTVFAYLAIMQLFPLMNTLQSESLEGIGGFFIRGIEQMIILYVLLFFGTRWINRWS